MSVNPAIAVRSLSKRLAQRRASDIAAEQEAKNLASAFADDLRSAGAVRVLLFGSLATGLFRVSSDIDLAASGLSERAIARFEREFTLRAKRPVEIVSLDQLEHEFRSRVETGGRPL